jgi:hypothetical protein
MTHIRKNLLPWAVLLGLVISPMAQRSCHGETLREVLASEPYRKVASSSELRTPPKNSKASGVSQNLSPRTNYDLLWSSEKSGKYLLEWIGVRNARGRLAISSVSSHREFAQARVALTTAGGVRVELIIQVPRPEYSTMAEYRTLQSFNRYRPPALDVVAEQALPLQGLEAKHYRIRDGSCSLLFETAKHGIVTLFTQRCSDSPEMINFTKALNFERLNSKLSS